MDEKITELKKNQQILGEKISMLKETNKNKDDEAVKIRELIAECRENLNRIKCDAMNPSQRAQQSKPNEKVPCGADSNIHSDTRQRYQFQAKNKLDCTEVQDPCAKYRNSPPFQSFADRLSPCGGKPTDNINDIKNTQNPCSPKPNDPCAKYRSPCNKPNDFDFCSDTTSTPKTPVDPCRSITTEIASQISALADAKEKSRQCIDKLGEKMEREVKMRILSSNAGLFDECAEFSDTEGKLFDMSECEDVDMFSPYQDRVSCRVDLTQMKVNIKGNPEDLKKLDAVQLVNLLDKYHCQDLIIHTGGTSQQDIPKVPVFYFTHPGNLILICGIIMMSYLVNSNFCYPKRGCITKMLQNMLYVGSFALHYGMILWMNFIRGFALSNGLSVDVFNTVDNLILPKYFIVCALLSALSLYSFLATHCTFPCTPWPLPVLIQVLIDSISFLIELITVCYIVPAIVKIRKANSGVYIEDNQCLPAGAYVKNVEKLMKLNCTMSFINTISIVLMSSKLYYVTSKLRIT